MGEKVLKKTLSVTDYLTFEQAAQIRHEFHDGEIFTVAGGTKNHGILGTNILTELNLLGRKKGCTTFNGDVKIRIEPSNRFVYPVASVVCGEFETSPNDSESITNPLLIVEVLSQSTEAYDRGEKFRLYRQLSSFREYLLIDQDRPIVSIFFRKEENVWEMQEVMGLDESLFLQSLNAQIKMADLYQNVLNLQAPLEPFTPKE